MEIYKSVATVPDKPDARSVYWGASQTEVAKQRKQVKRDHPGAEFVTQTLNVPTAKGSFVDWLNKNVRV